jgi:stage V sporulation protein G
MQITEVKINLINGDDLKAFASITFDDSFVVRGLKVIYSGSKFFVAMPTHRNRRGDFKDVAFPIVNELRLQIEEKVLLAYEEAMGYETAPDLNPI